MMIHINFFKIKQTTIPELMNHSVFIDEEIDIQTYLQNKNKIYEKFIHNYLTKNLT